MRKPREVARDYRSQAKAVARRRTRGRRSIHAKGIVRWSARSPYLSHSHTCYGTHSVDIDGELAQLDTDGYRPLRLAEVAPVSN
jgi:hypothetical protein